MADVTLAGTADGAAAATGLPLVGLQIASWSPADSAEGVRANTAIVVQYQEAVEVDRDRVRVDVEGVAHTVAGGGLVYWGHGDISGGAYVQDWSSISFAVVGPHGVTRSGQVIDVVAKYSGCSVDVDSASFTNTDSEGWAVAGDLHWLSRATGPWLNIGSGLLAYLVDSVIVTGVYYDIEFQVHTWTLGAADLTYLVGTPFWVHNEITVLAGVPQLEHQELALVVQGLARAYNELTVVAQGHARAYNEVALTVAVEAFDYNELTVLVGEMVREYNEMAMVVYGMVRDTAIQVEVLDGDAKAVMEALGITYSRLELVKLLGTVAGTCTATADLSYLVVGLAGTVAGACTATGDLEYSIDRLAGTVQGQATITGSLFLPVTLAGVVEGWALPDGYFRRQPLRVAGTVTGDLTATGDVTLGLKLAATAAGDLTAVGDLIVTTP